jgi:hypothetical protein
VIRVVLEDTAVFIPLYFDAESVGKGENEKKMQTTLRQQLLWRCLVSQAHSTSSSILWRYCQLTTSDVADADLED